MPEKHYVLRTCKSDMTSYGGFVWPRSPGSIVEAPDWDPTPRCGGGLHGLLNGVGDGTLLHFSPPEGAVWLIVEVLDPDPPVDLDGKVKFRTGKIVLTGDQETVTNRMVTLCPDFANGIVGRTVILPEDSLPQGGARAVVCGFRGTVKIPGPYGTAIVGDYGAAEVGDYGTAKAGQFGNTRAGNKGTAQSGDFGRATTGDEGYSISEGDGSAISGKYGVSISGNYGVAISGDGGRSVAGFAGKAITGVGGIAHAGPMGTAKAGVGGKIMIDWGALSSLKTVVGHVGTEPGMIKPDTFYRIGSRSGKLKEC